jgi:hypothetical protein
MLGALVAGCSTQQSPPRTANPNRYIYVSSANLPGQCYRDLGTIAFDEPFAAATIDEGGSNMSAKMRTLAVAKYPNAVDAIINVHPEQNDAGTAVKVTGEAIEIEDHQTVICAIRDLPPVMDSSAAAANAGMMGTLAGGLITGSPTGAMNTGALGALAVGAGEILNREQANEQQREQVFSQLVEQQREIRELLAERARLNNCEEQEIPLSDCNTEVAPQTQDKAVVPTSADYQNLSLFQLQKESAQEQDYITQLKQQVSDMKWQMNNPQLQ